MDSAAAGRGGRRQTCPQCGTAREAGGAPACGCAERAGDAAREAGSAEAAADFDPLRIRPYVTLPEPAAGATEPMPVVAPPVGDAPRSADVGLFASRAPEGDLPPPEVSYGPYDEPEPRRGRTAWYAGVGAAVAVVTVAVLAAGVFSSDDEPRRDRALPDAPTSAVDVPSGSVAPSGSASASASASRSADPSPSRTSSASASTSAPSATRSTARATGSVEPEAPASGQVLRRGDRGAEVVDLQERLQQLSLYEGEAHGNFNAPVASALTRFQVARGTDGADGEGVYGAATRAALEAETTP
ncbi:peptidoglycan-binding protein [Streptomyces sp. NBC_01381]|uniref:peptidoglycan-binding domain-containing protein n=1 Tax=Streptomyces sp. NBC_01381 TaxID=2903845 RepID=UPI00224EAADC|nr:peptidoglycan-binding domain-containing protein [Streptomyces sp. NBC_01381]MCX4667527.1 peptidoglycan-binding protein [Streptomyces sp. NBC_01381]